LVRFSQTKKKVVYSKNDFVSLPDIHPCTRTCHAPSLCPETEPCESLTTLTCPCNRIRHSVACSRTIISQQRTGSSSSGHAATPKCNNDCQTAKRNARLADALGISQEGRDSSKSVVYSDELVGFARGNLKFLGLVEKTFAE
jgi:transcriptional repressor NF-X1